MTRHRIGTGLVLAFVLAACGDAGGGAGGAPDPNLPDEAEVTSDDENAVVPLRAGRYRLDHRAPDCEPTYRITQQEGEFTREVSPRIPVVFISDIPNGEFLIEQTNAECDEWRVRLVRVS